MQEHLDNLNIKYSMALYLAENGITPLTAKTSAQLMQLFFQKMAKPAA